MGQKDPTHLVVGHLTRPHGTKGDFLCSVLTDYPESVFASGVVLSLGGENDHAPNPDLPPLRIESVREHPKGALVTFGGITDRTSAELFQGRYLYLSMEEVEPLAEGEIFYHQLLGMAVETAGGETIGTVQEVYEHDVGRFGRIRKSKVRVDRECAVPVHFGRFQTAKSFVFPLQSFQDGHAAHRNPLSY